ncbi:MAG: hypothetical protein R3C10_18675 [Pirellulales bacterium]
MSESQQIESGAWPIVGPDLASALDAHVRPLAALADGSIAAIVLRGTYPAASCQRLIDRLVDEGLLYDPREEMPAALREQVIPEGYYREGRSDVPESDWQRRATNDRPRIDIGTSLGYRGSDKEAFLAHSQQTHELFARLFADGDDPVRLLYDRLGALAVDRRVVTAHEPDGRRYGPAIIRAHYGGYTYKPHFDSVRLREKRDDYAVHAFAHQFAGVLVLQNSRLGDVTAQCRLHRCFWNDEVDTHLKADTFHAYAAGQGIENVEVCLEPGDLYFFNTRLIHEVPGVPGELPRVVLATFIGYDEDREDVFVWS